MGVRVFIPLFILWVLLLHRCLDIIVWVVDGLMPHLWSWSWCDTRGEDETTPKAPQDMVAILVQMQGMWGELDALCQDPPSDAGSGALDVLSCMSLVLYMLVVELLRLLKLVLSCLLLLVVYLSCNVLVWTYTPLMFMVLLSMPQLVDFFLRWFIKTVFTLVHNR